MSKPRMPKKEQSPPNATDAAEFQSNNGIPGPAMTPAPGMRADNKKRSVNKGSLQAPDSAPKGGRTRPTKFF